MTLQISNKNNFFFKRKLLQYFGGKFHIAKQLLPLIPSHKVYVEAFGGGATLLFVKQPSEIEIYNDINPYLTNFFQSFINNFEEFSLLLSVLPYSDYIRKRYNETFKEGTNIERAVKLFYLTLTNYGGLVKEGKIAFSRNIKGIKSYRNKKKYLPIFYERIKNLIVENKDFEEVIKTYDSYETFFFLDPPYLITTRKSSGRYQYELTLEQHIKLLELILKVKGKVMLSCYDNDIYKEYLKDWNKKEILNIDFRNPAKTKPRVRETIYMNYEI